MGIEIEYPLGYVSSGDSLFRDTGIIVRAFDQVIMFAFLIGSTTVLLRIPWHSSEKNMFSADVFCFFFK